MFCAGLNRRNEVKERYLGANLPKPRTELRGSGRCVNEQLTPEEKVNKDNAKGGIV